jgi:hypothetical protein
LTRRRHHEHPEYPHNDTWGRRHSRPASPRSPRKPTDCPRSPGQWRVPLERVVGGAKGTFE